jgi:hypothetical protein
MSNIKFHNNRPKLKEMKLRIVDRSEWKLVPDVDDSGFKRVTEMDGYRYIFVDAQGRIYDLRPQENKPSYNNFINKVTG